MSEDKDEVENPYQPIFTLATQTVINDKAESVMIPKVLCPRRDEKTGEIKLEHVKNCMVCEHHRRIPNTFVVDCGYVPEEAPEEDGEAEDVPPLPESETTPEGSNEPKVDE